eukprot:gnl/Trimastix_PCT/4911.p1 GENE.gnl/Trimastix_PCT/4911~~gnl/Trimastix_PCT/4911.p1  ORF type:complete len:491 (-),score=117.22 gnl/Trimastix_PCT/4911:156-1559(-)
MAGHVTQDMERLNSQLVQMQTDLDGVYADMRSHPYRLHSVLVHDGAAGGGHYWSYIYDEERNMWLRFNDALVVEATEDQVFKESLGGQGRSSAHCLVYVAVAADDGASTEKVALTGLDKRVEVPDLIRAYVAQDNAAFDEELRLKALADQADLMKRFVHETARRINQCAQKPTSLWAADTRLDDFNKFAWAAGFPELAATAIFAETHIEYFKTEATNDAVDRFHQLASEMREVIPPTKIYPSTDFCGQQCIDTQALHQTYVMVAKLTFQALNCLLQARSLASLREAKSYLIEAMAVEEHLALPAPLMRRPALQTLLSLILIRISSQTCAGEPLPPVLPLLHEIAKDVASYLPVGEHPVRTLLQTRWEPFFESMLTRVAEENPASVGPLAEQIVAINNTLQSELKHSGPTGIRVDMPSLSPRDLKEMISNCLDAIKAEFRSEIEEIPDSFVLGSTAHIIDPQDFLKLD